MSSRSFKSLFLAGLAGLGLCLCARANDMPVSLLVYPTYDNQQSAITLISVMNTNGDQLSGTVRVEFIYIDYLSCLETNRFRTLTPKDNFTANSRDDNPNSTKGYVYLVARSTSGAAIKFDYLIGLEEVFDGVTVDYFQIKPYGFLAGAGLVKGNNTDLNFNGRRDFNGLEYEAAPAQQISPRFLGQPGTNGTSDLVLINLTGGAQFTALINFLIFNDQEDVFSGQYSFRCWVRVPLLTISGAFKQTFLASTNVNGENVFGIEYGSFQMNGGSASSASTTLSDPAFLSMQIDRGVIGIGSAFLPYCVGTQTNGSLLAHSVNGN